MASFKQRRELAGGCCRALFGRAVAQEFHEHAHGRAAEGMAEQMDAPLRGPVRQHGFREGLAKAVVAFFFRMGNAVVDRGAGQVRVQFARAVPGGAERRHRRGVDLIALLPHARSPCPNTGGPCKTSCPLPSPSCRGRRRTDAVWTP